MSFKRLLALFLALVFCLSFAVFAYAEDDVGGEIPEPALETEDDLFSAEDSAEPTIFTVTFVLGDGVTEVVEVAADQTDDFGLYGILLKPKTPVRDDADGIHYEFDCWIYSDGTDFFGDQEYAVIYDDVELTARWLETALAELVEEPTEEPTGEHMHSYGEPVWSWRRIAGSWAAVAAFTCGDCEDVQYIRAEISETEAPGARTTAALVTFDGLEYTATRTDEVGYFVSLDGKTVNVYRLGGICSLLYGDGNEARAWYVNGELAAEGRTWYSFVVTENSVVTTAEMP